MMNSDNLPCFCEGQEVTVVFCCGGNNLKGTVCKVCDDGNILVIKDNNCKCYYINLREVKFIRTPACCTCCCPNPGNPNNNCCCCCGC